jgi:hypothetical protein
VLYWEEEIIIHKAINHKKPDIEILQTSGPSNRLEQNSPESNQIHTTEEINLMRRQNLARACSSDTSVPLTIVRKDFNITTKHVELPKKVYTQVKKSAIIRTC